MKNTELKLNIENILKLRDFFPLILSQMVENKFHSEM